MRVSILHINLKLFSKFGKQALILNKRWMVQPGSCILMNFNYNHRVEKCTTNQEMFPIMLRFCFLHSKLVLLKLCHYLEQYVCKLPQKSINHFRYYDLEHFCVQIIPNLTIAKLDMMENWLLWHFVTLRIYDNTET